MFDVPHGSEVVTWEYPELLCPLNILEEVSGLKRPFGYYA